MRSKNGALLLVTVLFLGALFSRAIAQASGQEPWPRSCETLADSNLNVRAEPDLEARIVATIPPRGTVPGLGLDTSGAWVNVEYTEGATGWAWAEFMRCTAAPEATTAASDEASGEGSDDAVPEAPVEPTAALGENGQLCVQVFDDNNQNGIQDYGDGDLTPASFQVDHDPALVQPDDSGCVIVSPGAHYIEVALPTGRVAMISNQWHVNIVSGYTAQLHVGIQDSEQEVDSGIQGEEILAEDSDQPSFDECAECLLDAPKSFLSGVSRFVWLATCGVLLFLLGLAFLVVVLIRRRRRAREMAA